MNDNDNERQLPPPIPAKLISNGWRSGKVRQQSPPRLPLRAVKIKADRCAPPSATAASSTGRISTNAMWICGRKVEWLWAKHAKVGLKQYDPVTGESVQTFVADDRLVLQAIDTTRGILDSLVKLRREMGHDSTGIPRWAISKIESALRNHPEALSDLRKALAEGEEIIQ